MLFKLIKYYSDTYNKDFSNYIIFKDKKKNLIIEKVTNYSEDSEYMFINEKYKIKIEKHYWTHKNRKYYFVPEEEAKKYIINRQKYFKDLEKNYEHLLQKARENVAKEEQRYNNYAHYFI